MDLIEKIDLRIKESKAEKARAKKATRWQSRIDALANRKKNSKQEAEFCADHGIDATRFNRQKKGHIVPSEEWMKKVEDAFRAEGV